MFGVTRKMAVRLYMNMRLRRKQAAQASALPFALVLAVRPVRTAVS